MLHIELSPRAREVLKLIDKGSGGKPRVRKEILKKAGLSETSYYFWKQGKYVPTSGTAKKIKEAISWFPPLIHQPTPSSMTVPTETLRDYLKRYMNECNISISDLSREIVRDNEHDNTPGYGAIYGFLRGSNPQHRTYEAVLAFLQEKGRLSRYGLPVQQIEMRKDTDAIDNTMLKSIGFTSTLPKRGDEVLDALQDEMENANVIAMIITSTLIKETTKRSLLGQLFSELFPHLQQS